jgi:hypothetical protein
VGGRYSCELGIDLDSKRSEEIFRWFLASVLFGARIGEKIAINTYNEFKKSGVLSPRKIIDTGWDGLVEILDSGGYVRYDFKTATKLLNVCDTLMKDYNGDHNLLHRVAKDEKDLEGRLKELGKGIGNVTVNIFLRELRDVWEKANPPLQELVILSARKLGFITEEGNALQRLRLIWKENGIKGKGIADFEVSLLRLSKNFCRKRKCGLCPVSSWCPEKEDSLY